MGFVIDSLKKCAVKLETSICGVPSNGSGIIYETPNNCTYNYILTAKHIFQEDSLTQFERSDVEYIDVFFSDNGQFKKLQRIRKKELEYRFIDFEEDFAIIIVDKKDDVNFVQIMVTDVIGDQDQNFFSWSIFAANENELHFFEYLRNDVEKRRIKLICPPSLEALPGISGSGVFIGNKYILYGVVCRYPNEKFENATIDCSRITFNAINAKLKLLGKVSLDTHSSSHKRQIGNKIVDIHQAIINNVCLNLELARRRLKADLVDDWFYDPLKYIDLLNQDYIFVQFEECFNENTYKPLKAEIFHVPKKKFTLRQALVSPFADRVMYIAVVGVLADKMDRAMINSVYSARFNRHSTNHLTLNGVEQWKKMRYALSQQVDAKDANGVFKYECILEIDLLNFYDNIDKGLLIQKISRVCETDNEKNACNLLSQMLNTFSDRRVGLPQNSDASSLLATFFLNQVDLFMDAHRFCYFRFMDDIRILCKDKYEARKILQLFESELRRCGLSVNSQKTEIKLITENAISNENSINRTVFKDIFDFELSKISVLRDSQNYAYLNQAFHLAVELLKRNLLADVNESDESARKLNYALNTIEMLGKKSIHLLSDRGEFFQVLKNAAENFIDKPWLTTQVCKVLNLLGQEIIETYFANLLEKIVLDSRYNTYAYQTYQIWLLLAKHKIFTDNLISYAVRSIERNDETNIPVIAAMVIYVCAVNPGYHRVILRKFNERFTRGYFQNRFALIALRSFDTKLIARGNVHSSLSCSPEFTNKYGYQDLVYVPGSQDDGNASDDNSEQLYSL